MGEAWSIPIISFLKNHSGCHVEDVFEWVKTEGSHISERELGKIVGALKNV
jgi:hypothetical protein